MPASTLTVRDTIVPSLGFGTWQMQGDAAREGVLDALRLGYRHIDTARMYDNEREVGAALAEAGVPRDELWLTSKVWMDDAAPEALRRSLEAQLEALAVDRLDLLLLHWPAPDVPLVDTLGALTAARDEGLISQLGVSNFPSGLLREAVELAPVFTNQVEYHAYLPQDAVIAVCREHDVMLTAYSPFAHGRLLDDPVLSSIAEDRGVTPGQVALSWLVAQEHVCAIPKASSHDRRAENLAALSIDLTGSERERIDALGTRGLRTADPSFAPVWD